eukprot:scaffold518760_cov19-Prasinocladus_malaysianus.AAC.1
MKKQAWYEYSYGSRTLKVVRESRYSYEYSYESTTVYRKREFGKILVTRINELPTNPLPQA